MSFMKKIVKTIKNRGAHSGLQQTSNSFKMAAAIVAPFLGVWFAVELFAPPEWKSIATTFSFIGWIVYLLTLYSKAKADVASFLPFPQSHWFFKDGQQVSYDLLVPPNGWEEIEKYKDGSAAYRVTFKEKCEYQEADRPYADIFNKAIWKLPAVWTDSFMRTGHGEFFFQNLFVDHPSCENIALSVIYWDERGSSRIPVCLIHSCSYLYNKAKETKGKAFPTMELSIDDAKDLAINDLKHKNYEIGIRNQYLENEAEQYHKEGPEDIIELRDKALNAFATRHKTIMNAGKKGWLTKLINGKTLGYALIAIAVLLILSHLLMGWP
jgi:hypothetical protein